MDSHFNTWDDVHAVRGPELACGLNRVGNVVIGDSDRADANGLCTCHKAGGGPLTVARSRVEVKVNPK
jgi:hypothetical protein